MIHDAKILDIDLPPNRRTQANLYQAEYFKMLREVQKAQKGIRRLKRRNDILQRKILELTL